MAVSTSTGFFLGGHMEQAIYVITGVMASGKSTVAQALAQRLERCVHLHGDVFRKMIVTGRVDMSEQASPEALRQLDMRYDIAATVAKAYFSYGFTVIVQDNYLGDRLPYFIRLLDGYPVYVIALNPDLATIEQRELTRGKKGYTGFSAAGLHRMFIEETPQIGFWLDTSNLSVEETVDIILKRASMEAKVDELELRSPDAQ
jgi:chloramphenicol 3-O-phosphotransferase